MAQISADITAVFMRMGPRLETKREIPRLTLMVCSIWRFPPNLHPSVHQFAFAADQTSGDFLSMDRPI